jgi:hypothetical protein
VTLTDLAKRAEKLVIDNSPSILTAVGVAGTITTAVLAGKASVRAAYILNDEVEARNEPISPLDCVKLTWQEFVPPVSVGTLTIVSIITANKIGNRRAAAVAAAYAVTEKAFADYKDKVIERIGETKEQAVRDSVAQDRVSQNPVGNQVIMLGTNKVLCYETFTGRYFTSSMDVLQQAQNTINHQILNNSYASLSEFYGEVGLPTTAISEEMGWNLDKLMELRFSSTLTENNEPCLAVDFAVVPVRGYHKLH